MRIEKPFQRRDKHAILTLDGAPVDLAKTPVVACDDAEGWIDFLVCEHTGKGAIRIQLDDNREPVIRREHGTVTIAFPEGM